ncbi:hypothetical protein [Actinoplanes sp. HUAS TT8]|uniref:hypothetical protein n=1 Tax=Actinoplanes sp. HUAS TT8 TaxID=3447453 RepID=UPI003F5273F6
MSYADDVEDYESYRNSQGEPSPQQLREWRATKARSSSFAHQEFLNAGPESLTARDALQVILRSTRRSRFRVLAIVCRRNHTISEVLTTPVGLVLLGVGPLTSVETQPAGGVLASHYHPDYGWMGDTEWSATWEQRRRTNREEPVVCLLEQLRRDEATLQCRCTTAVLDYADIERYLATGKRRVVYAKEVKRP